MADDPAVLSPEEKSRILHHLGYPTLNRIATIALGYPAVSQPMFIAESSFENVPQSAVGNIRRTLGILEAREAKQVDATVRLQALEIEGMKLNPDEIDQLDRELRRWSQRLSDDLGAPPNPYSQRFGGGASSVDVPIIRR
jgi:hypothetical protein